MTLHDLVEKVVIIAKETGEIIKNALHTLYAADIEVVGKYVLILSLGGLIIFGIHLLSDEIEEYRGSKENESGKLPWYLRGWALSFAIVGVILVVYAIIIVLII